MKSFVSIACAIAVIGFTNLAAAQGKGGPKVKATGASTHAASTKPATSKPATGKPTTTTTKTKTTTTAHGGGHTKATDTKTTGHAKTSTSGTGTTTTTTTTTATTGTTLTPVQQKLEKNTNLASKLQSRLPAGTDLNAAAADFRNLGQFVAAVNVSHNLGLDFTTLKTAMVTDGKSLGQAIQAQKGTTVDATATAKQAEADADSLIKSTEPKPKKKAPATGSGRS